MCSLDDVSSQYFEANYQPKTDVLKAMAVFGLAFAGTAAINHSWVAANQVSSYFTIKILDYQNTVSQQYK